MKKIYFLLFFVFNFIANAQIVNISDANFKAKLLQSNSNYTIASTETPVYNVTNNTWTVSSYHTIDVNGDGEIQVSEAQNIKWLNISSSSISDLTGIEEFVNLEYFNCYQNQIQNVNTANLMYLRYFNFSNNLVEQVELINQTNLQQLICVSTNLTSLDVSNLPSLFFLSCSNNFSMSSLNVSNCINLEKLFCQTSSLLSLDVSDLLNLEILHCNNNDIVSLDISGCYSLLELRCEYNMLNNIVGLFDSISLVNFYSYYNQLTSIDVSNLSNLQIFHCYSNQLEYLNIKNDSTYSSIDFSNNLNLAYICANENYIPFIESLINNYGFPNCHVNSYCTFTPGGIFYEINGNTKFDFNSDGCDVTDINYPNLKLYINDGFNSGSLIANSTGNYYIPVQSGIYTITPVLENPTYFAISPTSFIVDFPSQTSPFSHDFCVTANGVHSDVEIIVIPTTPARPGFDAHYRIIYKNIGNQVENGEVIFSYEEDVLDFISSSTIYDSQSVYGNTTTLHWNYSNLMPFETRIIDVVLNVNSPTETPAVNIGDVLGIFSEISTTNTDEDLSNNSSSLRQVVVGSYDPNDKTCIEGETVDVSMVGDYVHYVIRFENTGTYPAENIVVKDMIDTSKFEMSTLVPLHGSHEFFTRINGNKVEIIFENINLDFNDATNDGYVVFKIKTLPSLNVGDTFSNDANIYFDYNFPITTNEYVTTIDNLLNNQDFAFEREFVLYPNPTKNTLNISTKNQAEIQSIEIYNIVGQVVIAIPNSTKAINVSSLEAGSYFIKLNTEKGSTTTKFVKE